MSAPSLPVLLTSAGSRSDVDQFRVDRPAELVELSELLYRGIFSVGSLVATMITGYAVFLATLQPPHGRVFGIEVCVTLLALVSLALAARRWCYAALRRRPALILAPAGCLASASVLIGLHNEQIFYVSLLVLGVAGIAVPLRYLAVAALISGLGCALPHLLAGDLTFGPSMGAIPIPVFWLIIEQLGRFVLRLHQPDHAEGDRARAERGETGEPDAVGRTGPARLRAGGRRMLTSAPIPNPSHERVPEPRPKTLSARQLQVLLLCCEGLNHSEIAACLNLGPQQVRRHLRAARDRTRSATTAQLVAWAIRQELVPPPNAVATHN